ncbi:hypothetical protein [Paenibacillus larvae]|uniref:Uncharacterized protein n=1 Tax=Paenibacillus larvae subsp. larvae TaxID=147375 RepID=A0A6C0QMJ8_9BACL|nr:hypothetical protein [Paenibacillus larvae]QHZ49498.1 hypothetical protein ERICV_00284 [Paenibacillus larvae subsp. larvae]
MKIIKHIGLLIRLQHLLHFRWLVSRILPNTVVSLIRLLQMVTGLWILLGLCTYLACYALFLVLQNNGVLLPVDLAPKIEFLFCLLFFFYLLTHSFQEVYIRAFSSHDYFLLRTRGQSPFAIQMAKLIDAFFLEVLLYGMPIQAGIIISSIQAAGSYSFILWIFSFGAIVLFALICKTSLMILLFALNRQSFRIGSFSMRVILFFFQLFIGAGISYTVIRYMNIHSSFSNWIQAFMEWKWDIWFLSTGYLWLALLGLLLIPTIVGPVYAWNKTWDVSRWNKKEQGEETKKLSFLTRFFMSPGIRSKTLNLIMKDLLLTTRGETISWEFIKKVWLSSSCMLGGFVAFSYHLTGKEGISQGVLLLLAIISQMVLAGFATIAAGKVTSLDTEKNWIVLHFVRLENPYFIYLAKAFLHFFFVFPIVCIHTFVIILFVPIPPLGSVYVLTSAFCISLTSTLSFIVGSVCFPNFGWENKDQINTSLLGHITESAFILVYDLINVNFVGVKAAFLYAEKINVQDFLMSSFQCLLLTTAVWNVLIIIILRTPVWKGWKIK